MFKKPLLTAIAVLFCIISFAQVDTVRNLQPVNTIGNQFKNIAGDSSIRFPQDTFHLKSTWRGIGFKDTLPYYWNGTRWKAFGTGSGGTFDTATIYTNLGLKLNKSDTAAMLLNYRHWVAGYLTSVDTGNITSFWSKTRSLFSATAPVIYNNGVTSLNGLSGYGSAGQVPTSTGSALTWGDVIKPADTATMLLNYRHWLASYLEGGDTVSLSDRIDEKLNIVDTANHWATRVYRKAASDSVFYIVGGVSTFAFKDSIGAGGTGDIDYEFNVSKFGAYSPSDNLPAIQAAINAAAAEGGGIVKLNNPNYPIAGTIVMKRGVSLVGEGKKVSIITATTADPMIRLHATYDSLQEYGTTTIANIGLDGADIAPIGIDIKNLAFFDFNNLYFYRFPGIGLKLRGALVGTISKSEWWYCNRGADIDTSNIGATVQSNLLTFTDDQFHFCPIWGIDFRGSSGLNLNKVDVSANGTLNNPNTGGISVEGDGSVLIKWEGGWAEVNKGTILRIKNRNIIADGQPPISIINGINATSNPDASYGVHIEGNTAGEWVVITNSHFTNDSIDLQIDSPQALVDREGSAFTTFGGYGAARSYNMKDFTGTDSLSAWMAPGLAGVPRWYPVVSKIFGTTNQIIVSTPSGFPVLSLPQNIHTGATPEFLALGIGGVNGGFPLDVYDAAYAQARIRGGTVADILMQHTGAGADLKYFMMRSASGTLSFNSMTDGLGFNVANIIKMTSAGAIQFGAYGAGTLVTDGSGNVTATSDRAAKHSIRPYKYGLKHLKKINPVSFVYNQDSSNTPMPGFIAQDVDAALPLAVNEGKNGNLSLNTNAILAAAVNSIKELAARVEKLEKENAALKKLIKK